MKTRIYALRDETRYLRYVGKTSCSLEKRLAGHLQEAVHGGETYKNRWIRSMLSRGLLPSITLIEVVDGDGSDVERKWIKFLKDRGVALVNGTEGGEGFSFGHVVTPAMRQKISESKKGSVIPIEQRERIRKSLQGRKQHPSVIEKRRQSLIRSWKDPVIRSRRITAQIGKHFASEETKKKMSIAQQGKHHSAETIKKIQEAKRHTPVVTRLKMSKAKKGVPWTLARRLAQKERK